jgi:isopentenyl diphosphate isomerase/L-lactate dehydrogenase-like FMN-dependent dehydrogenase
MLVGATERDLSIGLFGMKLPTPLFMSPIGVIGLCAQDGHGDIATARAAAKTGVPMVASTLMVDPLEEGALADLLLVDGNPLADIKLIEDPAKNFLLIMKDGRVYKDLALD